MDTTPLWLIAVFAVVVILFLIYMEMRKQRKSPNSSHYTFNQVAKDPDEIYTEYPEEKL